MFEVMTPAGRVIPGTRIRILHLEDRYSPEPYEGREGVVKYIDSLGQLHGTWGGLAVIPETDEIEILSK